MGSPEDGVERYLRQVTGMHGDGHSHVRSLQLEVAAILTNLREAQPRRRGDKLFGSNLHLDSWLARLPLRRPDSTVQTRAWRLKDTLKGKVSTKLSLGLNRGSSDLGTG